MQGLVDIPNKVNDPFEGFVSDLDRLVSIRQNFQAPLQLDGCAISIRTYIMGQTTYWSVVVMP